MDDGRVSPGDRVITMQVVGVCRVVASDGTIVDIETPDGRRMRVAASSLRRLPPPPEEPPPTA
jgi:hypothetical protein